MKKTIHYILIISLFMVRITLQAQIYPTTATTILAPPHPVFLTEYYGIGTTNLQASLLLKDLSEPSLNVRIQVVIEGNGLIIKTKDSYVPNTPITLTPGAPVILQGTDFYQYLQLENISIQGFNPSAFNLSGGKFPEGMYNFKVNIIEYTSGKKVSNDVGTMVYLFQEQPPQILTPASEEVIIPSNPQSILFSWQIQAGASPILSATSQYELFLYKITDEEANPYQAVVNGQAQKIYQSGSLLQSTFNLNLATTALETGYRYVFNVRALDGNGKNVYANDGYSEWKWFYYGYPTGGVIELTEPIEGTTLAKNKAKFFSWKTSDLAVSNQFFEYKIKIVELDDENQEAQEAIANNSVWYEKTLSPSRSTNGSNHELTKNPEYDQWYAWQIMAVTEGQEVAISTARKFRGPAITDNFMAGDFEVKVLSTENGNPHDLTGVGLVQLSEDKNDTVRVEFEHLDLVEISGEKYLSSGNILFDLDKEVELSPEKEENGFAYLKCVQGRINSNGMMFKAVAKWDIPHPVTSNSPMEIASLESWVQVGSDFKLAGTLGFDTEGKEYTLIDPIHHKFTFKNNSVFVFGDGEYKLRMYGTFTLPESIRTNNGKGYELNFKDVKQISYLEVDYLLTNGTNFLQPVAAAKINIYPYKATIDLSEEKSPGKKAGLKDWKGVMFSKYKLQFPPDFDNTKQITFMNQKEFDIDVQGDYKFMTTAKGLFFYADADFGDDATLMFNGFMTDASIQLKIDENEVVDSWLKGEIKIPFVKKDEGFPYTLAMKAEGLAKGALNIKLDNMSFVHNQYGGENKMNVKILRAVFKDNERLDCELNVGMSAVGVSFNGLKDFRIYGDGFIGVGKKNGSKPLSQPLIGNYKGYSLTFKDYGASMKENNYALSFFSDIGMGDDIQGPKGKPEIAINSVRETGFSYVHTVAPPAPAIDFQPSDKGEQKLTTGEMVISIENKMIKAEGRLKMYSNDPLWGTSFKGSLSGDLKVPIAISVNGTMVLSDNKGKKFWYLDAAYQDKEGKGLPFIPPYANIVGFEGRIFKRMKLDKVKKEFVPDNTIDFGASLYLELIDQKSLGLMWVGEGGLELKIRGNDMEVNVDVDVSALNNSARADGVLGEVVKKAVEETVNQLLPLSFDTDVGSGNFYFTAKTMKSAVTGYKEGDLTLELRPNLDGVPEIGGTIKKGTTLFDFTGDADANGNATLNFDGFEGKLSVQNGKHGALDFKIDNLDVKSKFNVENKSGEINFTTSGIGIGLGLDPSTESAFFKFKKDDIRIYTAIESKEKAVLGIKYASTDFKINGNSTKQSGKLTLKKDGLETEINFNLKEGTASYHLEKDGNVLDLAGNKNTGGSFRVVKATDDITMAGAYNHKTGASLIELKKGNTLLMGELKEDQTGYLTLEEGGNKYGISGNKTFTKGGVFYSDAKNYFKLNADRTSISGDLDLSIDGTKVIANFNLDSANAIINTDGYEFTVGGNKTGTGYVSLEKDGQKIALRGNPTTKAGMILLKNPDDHLFIEADPRKMYGKLTFDYGPNRISGLFNKKEGNLFVRTDDFEMSAEGNLDGFGKVTLTAEGVKFGLIADASKKEAGLLFDNGTEKIDIEVNGINKTLDLESKFDKYIINSHVNENTKSIFASSTDLGSFNGSIDADKNLRAGLKLEEVQIAMLKGVTKEDSLEVHLKDFDFKGMMNKSSQKTSLYLKKDKYELDFAMDLKDVKGKFGLTDGKSLVNATLFNKEHAELNLVHDGFTLYLNGKTDGTGLVSMLKGDKALTLLNGTDQEIDSIFVKDGSIEFGAMAQISGKTVGANFKMGTERAYNVKHNQQDMAGNIAIKEKDLTVGLAYTKETADFKFDYDDVSVKAFADVKGKGDFSVHKENEFIEFGADKIAQTGYFKTSKDPIKLELDIDVPNLASNFLFNHTVEGINFNGKIIKSKLYDIHLKMPDYKFDYKREMPGKLMIGATLPDYKFDMFGDVFGGVGHLELTTPPVYGLIDLDLKKQYAKFDLKYDDYNLDIDFELDTDLKLNAKWDDLGLVMPNANFLTVKLPSVSMDFELKNGFGFNLGGLDLKINSDLDLTLGDLTNKLAIDFDVATLPTVNLDGVNLTGLNIKQTINVAGLDIEIQAPSIGNYNMSWIANDINIDLSITDKKIGSINFDIDGKILAAAIDFSTPNMTLYNLTYDGISVQYSPEILKMFKGANLGFEIKADEIAFNFDKNTFAYKAGDFFKTTIGTDFGVDISTSAFALSLPENKLIKVGLDGFAKLQFDTDKFIQISTDDFAMSYGKYGLQIPTDLKFTVKTPDVDFTLGDDLKLIEGDFEALFSNGLLKITPNKLSSFEFSTAGINIDYDKYKIDLSEVNGLKFAMDDMSLGIAPDLKLTYADALRTLSFAPTGVSILQGDLIASIEVGNLKLQTEIGTMIEFTPNFANLTYDKLNLKFGIDGVIDLKMDNYQIGLNADRIFSFADGIRTLNLGVDLLVITEGLNSISIAPTALGLKMGDYSMDLGIDEFKLDLGDYLLAVNPAMDISLTLPDERFSVNPNTGLVIERLGKKIQILKNLISLDYDANLSMAFTPKGFDAKFENYNIGFEMDKALYLKSPEFNFDLGANGLSLSRDKYFLSVSDQLFKIKLDTDLGIDLTPGSLAFKFDKIDASFDKIKGLKFTDGIRTFNLGETNLELVNGLDLVKIGEFNGLLGLELKYDKDWIKANIDSMQINYDGTLYNLSKYKMFSFDLGLATINMGYAQIQLIEGDFQLLAIPQTEFLQALYLDHTLALNTNLDLIYRYKKDWRGLVNKANQYVELTYIPKDITFGLNKSIKGKRFLTSLEYKKDYYVGLFPAVTKGWGVSLGIKDVTSTLSFEKGKVISGSLSKPSFGTIGVGINPNKSILTSFYESNDGCRADFTATSSMITLATKGDCPSVIPNIGGEAELHALEGTKSTPGMDGPQHLEGSMMDDTGGRLKGHGEMYYNSSKDEFILNAQVNGTIPCLDAAMAFYSKKGNWKLDVGSRTQRVSIAPIGCQGFKGSGWLHLTPKELEIGAFVGFSGGGAGSVDLGVCEVGASCYINTEMGIIASLDLDPFAIKTAEVLVSASAGLKVHYDCTVFSGSCTIAELSLKGKLTADFQRKHVSGTLRGTINIADVINESMDIGFSKGL